jgi:hypothetical protein
MLKPNGVITVPSVLLEVLAAVEKLHPFTRHGTTIAYRVTSMPHYKNTPLLQRIYALLEVEISVAKTYTNA